MSRAVIHETFGGPEVLEVREVPEPHAGPGEVRVRVTAATINPVDWKIIASADRAAHFNHSVPGGFGSDLAGVIDEVGEGVAGFAVGDRVFGGISGQATRDHAIVADTAKLVRTPDGIADEVACTLPIAGRTAVGALRTVGVGAGDTVLIGGAAGGVGSIAVQLARLAGATVIGTASEGTFPYLEDLGAQPVAYGPGLVERVRALAPGGITAALDLSGRETAEAALELGVAPERIGTIVSGPTVGEGVRATGMADAPADAFDQLAEAISAGALRIPIAARFPLERIGEAVTLLQEGHVHGKIIITM